MHFASKPFILLLLWMNDTEVHPNHRRYQEGLGSITKFHFNYNYNYYHNNYLKSITITIMIHSITIIIAKWPAANVHVAVTSISCQLKHVTRTTYMCSACLLYIHVAGNFHALKILWIDQNKGVNHNKI